VLCVAEGFATGASIFEATGYAVAVAFDAGNLAAVTKALHKKHPDLRVIVCADDDYLTASNPGISKATEAALSIGALLAVPDFGVDRPEKGHRLQRPAPVRWPRRGAALHRRRTQARRIRRQPTTGR
jgi:phage/plasmid primase-like uncharacterized protein